MRNLKVIFMLVGLILVVFLGTASAGQFGAPEPLASSGNISLGVGYFYNADKWKSSANSQDYKFSQNQIYLQFNATLDKIEFYIRGGGADLKFDNAFGSSDFNDNYKLFGTMGVKGILDINHYIGIGAFAQGSLFSTYKSQSSGSQELQIKNYSAVDVGLMLQGKFDKILVYAGPFLYWTYADMETSSHSWNLKQSNNFGGVAGIRVPIAQGINIEIEGQYRQEFSAGGAISYSF